jgi:hypothetical protein
VAVGGLSVWVAVGGWAVFVCVADEDNLGVAVISGVAVGVLVEGLIKVAVGPVNGGGVRVDVTGPNGGPTLVVADTVGNTKGVFVTVATRYGAAVTWGAGTRPVGLGACSIGVGVILGGTGVTVVGTAWSEFLKASRVATLSGVLVTTAGRTVGADVEVEPGETVGVVLFESPAVAV